MRIYKITPNSIHFIQGIKDGKYIIKAKFYTTNYFQPILDAMEIAGVTGEEALEHYLGIRKQPDKYPQVLFTVDNFNANSGGSGALNSGSQATWAAARGLATASSESTDLVVYSQKVSAGSWFVIRTFLNFDTSSIADGATTSDITLQIYHADAGDFFNEDTVTLHVVPNTQADPTSLTTADMDALTFTSKGSIAYSSIVADSYNDITVNVDQINLTGYTKLALIDSRDLNDSAPTGRNTLDINDVGAANPPVLVVTYTASIAYTKDLSETVTISEPSILKAMTKSSTETATITDTISKGGAKTFSEVISILERFVGRFGRASSFSKQEPDAGDWTRVS